ncbi:MAG: transposase [Candidatus Berkiella sp.]
MTLARSEQIDLSATPYYHVMNRCVRRSFLCGFDESIQKDYSHRKAWIVDRLKYLADIFAIKICAYAIMSNHYHVVLFVDDKAVQDWSEEEIVHRWSKIFSKDAKENKHLKQKIQLWKERLTSISWFMRCLNERIARDVNEEDDTAGRFWEGRFKSQALLDEAALLSAMVYVDLNPVRAGAANTPEESEFTSIHERIQHIATQLRINKAKSIKQQKRERADVYNSLTQPKSLVPFALVSKHHTHSINFELVDYLDLVDQTGRIIRDDKASGSIPEHLAPILTRLHIQSKNWVSLVKHLGKSFSYAIGSEILLLNFRKENKRGLKGMSQAQKSYSRQIA